MVSSRSSRVRRVEERPQLVLADALESGASKSSMTTGTCSTAIYGNGAGPVEPRVASGMSEVRSDPPETVSVVKTSRCRAVEGKLVVSRAQSG